MSNESPSVTERLRRDLAIHRAGTLMGIALRARQEQGLPWDAHWCRQTFRAMLEGFELETTGREADATVAARVEAEQLKAEREQRAMETRLSYERSRARVAAAERGHDLGPWHGSTWREMGIGDEHATCQRCERTVSISLGNQPVLTGSALLEGCLSAAEGSK